MATTHASHPPHLTPTRPGLGEQPRSFPVPSDNYDISKSTRPSSSSPSSTSPHPRPLNESQTITHMDPLTDNYDPSKVHILVVDDDVLTRKILQSLLRKFCFNGM